MNKFLLFVLVILSIRVQAQVDVANDTIYVSGSQDITYAMPVRVYNKSDYNLPFKIKRRLVSHTAQYYENNFCWVVCYGASVSESPSSLTVNANAFTDLFVIDFRPYQVLDQNTNPPTLSRKSDGVTVYTFTVYSTNNPKDSVVTTVKYTIKSFQTDENGDPILDDDGNPLPVTDTTVTIKRKSAFTQNDTIVEAKDPYLNLFSTIKIKKYAPVNISNDTIYVSGNKDVSYSMPIRVYNKSSSMLPVKIKRKLVYNTAPNPENKFSWVASYGAGVSESFTPLNVPANGYSDAFIVDFRSFALLDANADPPLYSGKSDGVSIYTYTVYNAHNPYDSVVTTVKYTIKSIDNNNFPVTDTTIIIKTKSTATQNDTVIATKSPYVYLFGATGTKEQKKNHVALLESNPVKERITFINKETNKNTTLHICNCLGQTIYSGNLMQGTKSVDCSNWTNGLYVYTLTNEDKIVQTGKIVVQQ